MIPALLAGLLAAAFLAVFAWSSVDGLWRPDAFDYAQIARELAEGRGFASRHAIYALHLEFLKDGDLLAADWPNLHRFPLPSLCLAAGFRLFGAVDAVVVGYGIVFHGLTAAVLFAWARAAVGTAAAAACVLLFTVNGTFMELAASGLAEPPVLLGFTLALSLVWWQARRDGRLAPSFAAGCALGLAGLARTNALFVAPLFAVALALAGEAPRGRRRAALRVLLFLAGAGLVSLPWWIRNAQLTGDPFFSLHTFFLLPSGTGDPNAKWDLTVPWVRSAVSPLAFLVEEPHAVLAKAGRNGLRFLGALPTLGGLHGVVLVAALAAVRPAGTGLRPIAWLVFASLVANALLVSFVDFFLVKYHLHLVPALCLLAVAAVWRLASFAPEGAARGAVCAVAVLLLADAAGAWKAFRVVPARIARYDREHFDTIRRRTAEDAVVVSDQSHAVAWETGRRSVRLHYDRTAAGAPRLGVLAIDRAYLPVDAVYLSRAFLRDPDGVAILNRTLATQPRFRREFPVLHPFDGGGLLFLRAEPPLTPRSRGPADAPASPDPPDGAAPQ